MTEEQKEKRRLYFREYNATHKEVIAAYKAKWSANHERESHFTQTRYLYWKIKLIGKLGGCCEVCKNEDYRVLEFDHRNNDGYLDRKTLSGTTFYKQAFETDEIQSKLACLCANCHRIKTYETDAHGRSRRKYGVRVHYSEVAIKI